MSVTLYEVIASSSVDADIQKELSTSAKCCLGAKERLLGVGYDTQIETAIRNVEIPCYD